jgi:fructose-bisphosphate aldolase class I
MERSATMTDDLAGVAQLLVAGGRGIIALDESPHPAYPELVISTPGVERYVAGAILDDETVRRTTSDGRRFVEVLRGRRIVPGVRVTSRTANIAEYAALGAGIAVMRGEPRRLARFAARCQRSGIVPIVEPEVKLGTAAAAEETARTATRALRELFYELAEADVALEALILSAEMIVPAGAAARRATTAEVVSATLRVLGATVPVAVAGVVFLTGAQHDRAATERLCALNRTMPRRRPWPLTFTYDRALQQAVLDAWRGRPERIAEAQRVLLHRAHCSGLAACGAYTAKSEEQLETFAPPLAA